MFWSDVRWKKIKGNDFGGGIIIIIVVDIKKALKGFLIIKFVSIKVDISRSSY